MGPGNYPPPLLRPSQLLTCGHSFKGGSHSTGQLPIHPDTSASSSPGERSGGVPWQLLLPVSHVFPMLSVAGILSWFQGKGHAVQANLWGSPSPHPDSRQPQSSTQSKATWDLSGGGEAEANGSAWQGTLGHSTAISRHRRVEWRQHSRMLEWLHTGEREG